MTEEDLYYFDENWANAACGFFEMLRLPTGRWAGEPWELIPWQREFLRKLYGWRRRSNGLRQYEKVFIYIPRKQSKTTFSAGLALLSLVLEAPAVREGAPWIPLAASSREQAGFLFDIASRIVKKTPELDEILTVYDGKKQILHPGNDGVLKTVSSDGGTSMGGDVYASLIDELHTIGFGRGSTGGGQEMWDALNTGSVSRSTKLLISMTTAGASGTQDTLWMKEYRYAKAVLSGKLKDDYYLPLIYEGDINDDPFDPEVWKKANPSLGYTVDIEYYEQEAVAARNDPSKLNSFKRLYLNIIAGLATAWIPKHALNQCIETAIPEVSLRAWVGVDLSGGKDLTSVAILWEPNHHEKIQVRQWSFVPESDIKEKGIKDGTDYLSLSKEKDPSVILTPGAIVDYEFVLDRIKKLCEKYDVQSVGFDRWNTSHMITQLENENITTVGVGMGYASMNAPVKAIERWVYSNRFAYNGDSLIESSFENAAVVEDPAGNRKLDKSRSNGRIDPAIAVCIAAAGMEPELYEKTECHFWGNDPIWGED